MLKRDISYLDYDDKPARKTLWFNLTETELQENIEIIKRFQVIADIAEEDQRDVTPQEIRYILDLMKDLMRLSYGVRSADGERFSKKPELWEAFTETAAYNAFLLQLFQNIQEAWAFITGILPKDLRGQAIAQTRAERPDIFKDLEAAGVTVEDVVPQLGKEKPNTLPVPPTPLAPTPEGPIPVDTSTSPLWLLEGRAPTPEEFAVATPEQQVIAYRMRTTGS